MLYGVLPKKSTQHFILLLLLILELFEKLVVVVWIISIKEKELICKRLLHVYYLCGMESFITVQLAKNHDKWA